MIARMQGALRRTPSPQQLLDGASRRVAGGVAAAGAMMSGALTSIREEDKGDFEDHSRWSEEKGAGIGGTTVLGPAGGVQTVLNDGVTDLPKQRNASGKKKVVAIVTSAESLHDGHDDDITYIQEHAVSGHHYLPFLPPTY
jgi:hypothetical protein